VEREPELAEKGHQIVLDMIRNYSGSGNLVLVTHRENVAAWTGVKPREAEAVIVAPEGDSLKAIGRIVFN
jgi:hypothetical protein